MRDRSASLGRLARSVRDTCGQPLTITRGTTTVAFTGCLKAVPNTQALESIETEGCTVTLRVIDADIAPLTRIQQEDRVNDGTTTYTVRFVEAAIPGSATAYLREVAA